MRRNFAGLRAFVTGGTSGIGRAIARAFAAEGSVVTVAGVDPAEIEACREESPEFDTILLDVRDDRAVRSVIDRLDRLDILVNAAGILLRGGAEFDPREFANVVDVNLSGTHRLCVASRPRLAERQGCILNVASMLSTFGSGFVPAYSASKGGVAQLTKSLAIAWAPDGIRVNAIAPGWIETPMTRALREDDSRASTILGRTPLGRWGRPEDLTGPALFLCSPEAAFITGAILPVDGGYSVA